MILFCIVILDPNTSHKLKNFEHLARANLTVNLAKCEFGKATLTYLDKVVGGGCVKLINAKVEAVCSFPSHNST